MTCTYCGQELKAGDRHAKVRIPTEDEQKQWPDVSVLLVCKMRLPTENLRQIGVITNIGEGQGPEPTLTDAGDYAS